MNFLLKKNSQDTTQQSSEDADVCPYCKNSGWEYDYETNTARECRCGLRQRQIMESKLRFADIPLTYKNIRLPDIKSGKYAKQESKDLIVNAKKTVEFYLEHLEEIAEEGRGLFFYSDTKGSGKTMLASALANELIYEYKKAVKFATSMQIINEIKASWNNAEVDESKLLKDLASVDYLVIDDFGTENVKDWIGEKFYQIINSRYINKKVTFYTSNYSIKNLPYEERITNRITERSLLVKFPEESIREMIAKVENAKLMKEVNK